MSGERDPDAIRVLTVQQPFAYGIMAGVKPVENRTQRTWHRGRVAIHAGLGWSLRGDLEAREAILEAAWVYDQLRTHRGRPLPGWVRGHVLGFVEIVGCHEDRGCCRPFGEKGTWHWELARPVLLTTPIRARGQLNLWRPDKDLRAALSVAT